MFSGFFCKEQEKKYWLAQAGYAALALVIASLAWYLANMVSIDGIHGFLVKGTVAAIASGVLLLAIFRKDALELLKAVRGKRLQ